ALEARLPQGLALARDRQRPERCAAAPGDASRNERRLVESSLREAARVELHRNDEGVVETVRARLQRTPEQVRERTREVRAVLVFHPGDRARDGASVG